MRKPTTLATSSKQPILDSTRVLSWHNPIALNHPRVEKFLLVMLTLVAVLLILVAVSSISAQAATIPFTFEMPQSHIHCRDPTLVTADQNIPDQQALTHRRISLLILCGPTNGKGRSREAWNKHPGSFVSYDVVRGYQDAIK